MTVLRTRCLEYAQYKHEINFSFQDITQTIIHSNLSPTTVMPKLTSGISIRLVPVSSVDFTRVKYSFVIRGYLADHDIAHCVFIYLT